MSAAAMNDVSQLPIGTLAGAGDVEDPDGQTFAVRRPPARLTRCSRTSPATTAGEDLRMRGAAASGSRTAADQSLTQPGEYGGVPAPRAEPALGRS